MKLSLHKMYIKSKYLLCACLVLMGTLVNAQVTIQSPYSKFGIGNLKGTLLPQLRAMGGISTAVFKPNYFNNINMQNPASYAGINTATLDMGMSGGFNWLANQSQTENSFNAALSHVAMAFNVSPKSGISFGVMPHSQLGYNFKNSTTIGTNPTNTKNVDYKYIGEGGVNKAYIGYGIQLGDHFRVGANLEYLFGKLEESRSTEFINDPGSLNSRDQQKNSISGTSFSYGLQYDYRFDSKTSLVIGYSGSSSSTLNSQKSQTLTQYTKDDLGNEFTASDTLLFIENNASSIKMPLIHNFGVVLQKDNKWLVGLDYRLGRWANFNVGGVNEGLQNTHGFSVGSQFTPDVNSINSYFKRIDYRVGFQYDKTYIQMAGKDINQMAITAGVGLPLSSLARGAFYKMNITAELGQRGTIANGLLQERYLNLHLSFTLNDGSWFRRFKFD